MPFPSVELSSVVGGRSAVEPSVVSNEPCIDFSEVVI
jgi:hypothetical protein